MCRSLGNLSVHTFSLPRHEFDPSIEKVRLDVREIQTVSVDVNDDGIADLSISDAIPDKKQGEDEKEPIQELAAKDIPMHRGRS